MTTSVVTGKYCPTADDERVVPGLRAPRHDEEAHRIPGADRDREIEGTIRTFVSTGDADAEAALRRRAPRHRAAAGSVGRTQRPQTRSLRAPPACKHCARWSDRS